MKTDASGPLIETNGLGRALGFETNINSVNNDGSISNLVKPETSNHFTVNLLLDYTGGGRGNAHYFMLYDKQQDRQLTTTLEEQAKFAASSTTFRR
jgi:hypothetical protein